MICLPGSALFARHGKGGSITYQYLGAGTSPNTSRYQLTIKHYIDCNSPNLIEPSVFLGIFDVASSSLINTLTIPITDQVIMQKMSFNSCINPQPVICFYVVTYITQVELIDNNSGYTLAEQECCRINGIVNIQNSSNYGSTNTNTIPGAINGIVYRQNSSPVYAQKDTAVICHSSPFTIDFNATDEDGDSLTYAFCAAKAGAGMRNRQPNPPPGPPYEDLPYQGGYTADAPLGSQVNIDANTGLISGIAPAETGSYVIAVCVSEYRKGVLIGVTKKEVQITVADCTLSGAALKEVYVNCDDFHFDFTNESGASNVDKYAWDFGVPSLTTDTSGQPLPSYTYPDTGTYILKLRVSSIHGCQDSASALVKVYPGFRPGYTVSGRCYLLPFQFTDTTFARYGTVDSWAWNLGDGTTSALQSPSHQYATAGTRTVTMLVSSSKGCSATITKSVIADSKPELILPFHDTLICSIDTLPLIANGTGIFSWTPSSSMRFANTARPLVAPKDTTTYIVTLEQNGCVNTDSIIVNVLDFITVNLPPDTVVCATDHFPLNPVSHGLQYLWTPATGLSSTTVKYPMASPPNDITYHVTAHLGKCEAEADTRIRLVPYPKALVNDDLTICFGKTTRLHGTITASSFIWSPTNTLLNASTLDPTAGPSTTTAYVLIVYDTLGCPKPSTDTVIVTVTERIQANAGNDTTVVAGQALQLKATGDYSYTWSPTTGLNNPTIADPIGIYSTAIDSVIYTVRVSDLMGCYAEDQVKVKVFKTQPDLFVPTAFTPNGDSRNDIIKPIPVGIKTFSYFRIYNRLGQLLYQTTAIGQGWDGTFGGTPQPSGTYVFMTEGVDYTGKLLQRKGTLVLIR